MKSLEMWKMTEDEDATVPFTPNPLVARSRQTTVGGLNYAGGGTFVI